MVYLLLQELRGEINPRSSYGKCPSSVGAELCVGGSPGLLSLVAGGQFGLFPPACANPWGTRGFQCAGKEEGGTHTSCNLLLSRNGGNLSCVMAVWARENSQEGTLQRGVEQGFLFAPGCDTENATAVGMVCSSSAGPRVPLSSGFRECLWELGVSTWMTLENADFHVEIRSCGMGSRARGCSKCLCCLCECPCSAQPRLALPRMIFDASLLEKAGSGGICCFVRNLFSVGSSQ